MSFRKGIVEILSPSAMSRFISVTLRNFSLQYVRMRFLSENGTRAIGVHGTMQTGHYIAASVIID